MSSQLDILLRNFVYTFSRLGGEIVLGLVTTPVLIAGLGLEAFGLLVTIGASGMLLSVATRTVQQGIARELGFWIGRSHRSNLHQAFASALVLQIVTALALVSIGLLLVSPAMATLTIPVDLRGSAEVALVLTVLQFGVAVLASPFAALLLAHQDLKVISIVEFLTKLSALLAALYVLHGAGDGIVAFVAIQFATALVLNAACVVIAVRRYEEAVPRRAPGSLVFMRSILSFGALAFMNVVGTQLRRNGITVFLNIVYGNTASAAHGLALRLSSLMVQVVLAVKNVLLPAMTLNTGSGNRSSNERLVPLASMISFCATLPLAVPFLTDTSALLESWLRQPAPEMAVVFTRILVVSLLVSTVSQGQSLLMHADGRIGMLVVVGQSIVIACVAAFCYLAVRFDWPASAVLLGELLGMTLVACVWQPVWARSRDLLAGGWIRLTLVPVSVAALGSLALVGWLCLFQESGLLRAVAAGSLTTTVCAGVFFGMAVMRSERRRLLLFAQDKLRRS